MAFSQVLLNKWSRIEFHTATYQVAEWQLPIWYWTCSDQEWQFPTLTSTGQGYLTFLLSHIDRSTGRCTPQELTSGQGWQLSDQLADLPPKYTYAVQELTSYRQSGRSTSPETSSDQGWPLADQLADPPTRTDI